MEINNHNTLETKLIGNYCEGQTPIKQLVIPTKQNNLVTIYNRPFHVTE